jgi:hypothetical protein
LLAIGGAALVAAAALIGARLLQPPAAKPPHPAQPAPDSTSARLDTLTFSQLRPREGDHMAPPRIGFRWSFRADSAAGAETLFRVHLRSVERGVEVTRDTRESSLNVDLAPSYPLGPCEWWVEAIRPGHPVIRSRSESFRLEM